MQYRNGQRLPPEGPERLGVAARLSVNPRARRLSIRIDARVGEAVLIAPSERKLADVVAFARTKASWMRQRLAERPHGTPLEPGAVIDLFGRPTRLIATGGAGAARLTEDEDGPVIASGGEGEAYARRVENLFKRVARETLQTRTDVHLRTLGQRPVRMSIADPKSRWGSCSPHNRSIRYSWRVVMAPSAVIDYLAAHEVAHLVHADHSPAYWSVVQSLVGDHRPFRKWLRDNGPALHAVGR
ncbi:MAG: SprT family zinc-dependent metalloprotease [Brevundimonas sp.]|uniref:M48 family metallopeptidase n=1 Tax=Brevundimonas sp. TaxID=1871086 RepID=UPI002487997B|nr:SprT family zinc-dependent metalloprotease [Brevundimonas sp.]MDI1327832.1 SprT family zinc-dependent metalloprotease [Brevundimonas sp.]